MAATTFSSNYQIKLIGTGLESGTWGSSTNENFKRLEQSLGQPVSIDPIGASVPGGSSGATTDGLTPMKWVTLNSADAGESSSKGRARFVEFKNAGTTLTATIKVEIYGDNTSSLVDRIYVVKNNLTQDQSLELGIGVGDVYTLRNGAYAFVSVCQSSSIGGISQGINNLLSKLQIDNLVFPDSESATVTIADDEAAALTITNGTDTFLTFDSTTDGDKIDVAVPLNSSGSLQIDATTSVDINSPLIDLETQATSVKLKETDTAALEILQGADSYLKFNTSGGVILAGDSAAADEFEFRTSLITIDQQGTDLQIKNNQADALDIKTGSGSFILFDTLSTEGGEKTLRLGDVANVVGSGDEGAPMRLDVEIPDTTFASQASTITMKDADASALVFRDADAAAFLTFDTAGEKITFGKPLDGVDIDGGSIDNAAIGGTTPAGGTFTQVDITGAGELRLQDTTGGEYIGMKAATETTSYSLTMPAAVGLANQVLSASDGSGTLAWTAPEVGDLESVANVTNGGIAVTDGGGPDVTLGLDFNDLSAATVSVASDSIGIIDADDNSTKKESIADLVVAMGGTGLTGASGLLSVDPSQTQITSVGALAAGSIASGFTSISTSYTDAKVTSVIARDLLDDGGSGVGDVILDVDLSELDTSVANVDGDFFVVLDTSEVQRKLTKANIDANGFDTSTLEAPAGSLTGTTLKSTVITSSLTAVGTISSGTWGGTAVAVNKGGTGLTSYAAGDILYASGSTTLAKLPKGSDDDVLTLSSGVPSWDAPTVGDLTGIVAGAGLLGTSLSGPVPTVNVVGTDDKITVGADAVTIATTYAGQTSIDTLGTVTTGVWNGTVITGANIDATSSPLADTNIWIGSASNVAAEFALSGDATMTAGGVVTVSTAAACSGNAATASEVSISASSLNATNYLAFVDSSTGTDHIGINTGFTFNPADVELKMTDPLGPTTTISGGSFSSWTVQGLISVQAAQLQLGISGSSDTLTLKAPTSNDEYTVIFPSSAGSAGDFLKISSVDGSELTCVWSAT